MESIEKYRKMASFDSHKMTLAIESQADLDVKEKVWRYFKQNPLFELSPQIMLSKNEKELTARQLQHFITHSGFFNDIDNMCYEDRTKYLMIVNEATEMYNANLSIKFALGVALFSNALSCLGTERHRKFYDDVWSGKILSCLAITELEHGSDTKRLKTVAVYDHETKEFVLNTPDEGAAKCWVGNLGMQCTHALLFAKLIVNDMDHGLHGFIVPVRNPVTLQPFPNLIVGDIGEKAGLNGIDNGFVMFKNYRIPKENLMNRTGDINENGEYESCFKDPQKLLGASLETLSAGRVGIMRESSNCLIKSVVIAIRYAAQRSQFASSEGEELPIIEYQTHRWRLFPYLAAAYTIRCFVKEFSDMYIDWVGKSRQGKMKIKETSQMVSGTHAIVCCSKALITWTSRDAIQECREACGGHGYHKAAGLVDLRSGHDPRVTFEGDNTVLLQQTSNWLLRIFSDPEADFTIFPLSLYSFVSEKDKVLMRTYQGENVLNLSFVIRTYQWLICWLATTTQQKIDSLHKTIIDKFEVRNLCQVFKARTLALVFAEYTIIVHFEKKCQQLSSSHRNVLSKLGILYGLWSLYKHVPLLYQGGHCTDPRLVDGLSEGILTLCDDIKPEAVSLVDAIAPPDFVLNSVLGCKDGKVYERLMDVFYRSNSMCPHMKSKI